MPGSNPHPSSGSSHTGIPASFARKCANDPNLSSGRAAEIHWEGCRNPFTHGPRVDEPDLGQELTSPTRFGKYSGGRFTIDCERPCLTR
jgi:hypothetical protein